MKKLLSLLLSLALILTLTACGNTPDVPVTPTDDIADSGITEIATETGGDSTTESITETATQTVTNTPDKPVTEPDDTPVSNPDDKPTTTEVVTNNTNKPISGSGSASTSNPTYTGNTTNKSTTGKHSTTKTDSTRPYDPTGTTLSMTPEMMLVDQLFKLSVGESKTDVTLNGIVTDIEEVSAKYGNATFTIQVEGGYMQTQQLYCYRVKPVDTTQLQVQVGQVLTLSGTVQNYKGTIEFYPATYQISGGATVTTTTTRPISSDDIDRDGIYDSKEEVALYIHTYGCLPKNYITKSQYKAQGKPRDKTCGGDRFYNNEGLLPSGHIYYECDIDTLGTTNRGAKRIVWTTTGIVYYTSDHYASFTKLYGER